MTVVEDCELITWRKLEPKLRDAVDTLVALNGDRVSDDLRTLQHDLVQIEVERKALGGDVS